MEDTNHGMKKPTTNTAAQGTVSQQTSGKSTD